jgi:hypothetical protein
MEMMEIITAILSAIGLVPPFAEMINKQAESTKGLERGLILEMKTNAELVQLHRDGEVSADEVIKQLEVDKLEKALDSDFKFTTIKRGKVKAESTAGIAFFEKYIGWTTEELFENLFLKIEVLKKHLDMAPDSFRIRKDVRLINILKMIKLIIIHIDE